MRDATKVNPLAPRPPASAEPRPLRLVEHYLVPVGPGELQIRTAGRTASLRGPTVELVFPHLLPLLDGRFTEAEIIARLAGKVDAPRVRGVVKVLREKGLLEEVAPPPAALDGTADDYRTLVRFFGGYEIPAALRQARVLVAAGGGVTAALAGALARCGIGHITVVGDEATLAEVRAQAIARPGVTLVTDSGRPDDVEGWKARLTGQTLAVAVAEGPIVLQPWAAALNEAAIEVKVPWTSFAFLGAGRFQVGPTVIPELTACLGCFAAHFQRQTAFLEGYAPWQRFQEEARSGATAGVGPIVDLAASLAAIEVTRAAAPGQDALTYGRIYTIDVEEMTSSFANVPKVPRCPVCGPTRGSPKMRVWS